MYKTHAIKFLSNSNENKNWNFTCLTDTVLVTHLSTNQAAKLQSGQVESKTVDKTINLRPTTFSFVIFISQKYLAKIHKIWKPNCTTFVEITI